MRFLIVGKFPPIQGGVSSQTYWAVRDLVSLGHSVCVLTCADGTESGFTVGLSCEDTMHLERLGASGDLQLYGSRSRNAHSKIPFSRSDEALLLERGFEFTRRNSFDAIVGWYLYPFGLVAARLARDLHLPLIAIHAGSDLFRLANHPDLADGIRHVLESAARVVTSNRSTVKKQLVALGSDASRHIYGEPGRLPSSFAQVARARRRSLASSSSDHGVSRIIAYTKLGLSKGTFDAIAALDSNLLGDTTFSFNLIRLGRCDVLASVERALVDAPRTRVQTARFDPVTPWKVPHLLANNDIVFALERDFAIAEHGSMVPREALAAGCCLVISGELARKQPFAAQLRDRQNVVVVPDPQDKEDLARRLQPVLSDTVLRSSIARGGQFLSAAYEQHLPSTNPYATAILRAAEAIC